jgi:hypothetical protein
MLAAADLKIPHAGFGARGLHQLVESDAQGLALSGLLRFACSDLSWCEMEGLPQYSLHIS